MFTKQVHHTLFARVENRLTKEDRVILDGLLTVSESNNSSLFTQLKDFPSVAKLSEIKAWVVRCQWLDNLLAVDQLLEGIRFTKIENFASQAYTNELSNIKAIMNQGKKYTLLLCLLYVIQRKTKDELTDLFIRRIRNMHFKGRDKLENLKAQQRGLEELMLQTFGNIVDDALGEPTAEILGVKVKNRLLEHGGLDYFQECMHVLAQTHGQNYYPLLWKMHAPYRKILLDLVVLLDISSATSDDLLIECLERYLPLRNYRRNYIDQVEFRLDFLSQRWRQTIEKEHNGKRVYDRKMLELALLSQLSESLQTTDVFVPDSLRYGDYRQQMISEQEAQQQRPRFCKEICLENTAEAFVTEQKTALRQAISTLEEAVNTHESFWIDKEGKVRMRRKRRAKPNKAS